MNPVLCAQRSIEKIVRQHKDRAIYHIGRLFWVTPDNIFRRTNHNGAMEYWSVQHEVLNNIKKNFEISRLYML